jgi:ribosome-binding factor A
LKKAVTGRPEAGKSASGKPYSPKARSAKPASAKAPTQRQLRVSEEIRHVLSGVFLRAQFRDPDLANEHVTVTEVRISPDLRNATAFVARLGRSDVDELLPALKRAAVYLRGEVAKEMRLRVAPNLSFQPDATLEYAVHINKLMLQPEVARDLAPEPSDDAE